MIVVPGPFIPQNGDDQILRDKHGRVAPDPRWFALQKLWLADQEKRESLKRPKDARQATALLDSIAEVMPQYPLDEDFETSLPPELQAYYAAWKGRRREPPRPPSW